MIPSFLAPQGPKKFSSKLQPSLFRDVALLVVIMFTAAAPLVGVARKILATGTKYKQMLTVGLLGVLVATTEAGDVDGGPPGEVPSADPTAATNETGDVDGGPPVGCYRDFRQRPPMMLKTSTAGPLGVLAAGPTAATTDVEDVNGRPFGGAGGRSGSGHH
jgi:hypothetical protein